MILIIIIATVLLSVFALNREEVFRMLMFNAYAVKHNREYHRLFTNGFIHADWIHLGINMFVLYSFGSFVEEVFPYIFGNMGKIYFAMLYFGAIPISVIPSLLKHKNNTYYNSVGASGAVSAVVFASILFNPLGKIYLFMIPIGIPAFIFGILYLIYSAYMAKRAKDNIGHDAHFAGAIYGLLFIIIAKPEILFFFLSELKNYLF